MTKEANQIRNKYSDFSKINMDSTFNNPYLEFLVDGCKISLDKFDSKGDCINGWSVGKKSGPPYYLKVNSYLILFSRWGSFYPL